MKETRRVKENTMKKIKKNLKNMQDKNIVKIIILNNNNSNKYNNK
jgi:hypothetical protein